MTFSSTNPATGEVVWTGAAASPAEVDAAVERARQAARPWARRPLAEREACLRAFAEVLGRRRAELAEAISREVGKPRWEAATEVQSMIGKIDLACQAHARRTADFTHGPATTRFRPHGVCAVFGPFNFPGHLPNGHIAPALLAGNTVVFKPSEFTPLVAERTLACWQEAGLPPGVLEVVYGARDTGARLAAHPGIDGLFFTGSARTGLWLAEQFARTPEKILALELGGNNPLVVWEPADAASAARLILPSAYLTAGQRCTCARRLIVPDGPEGDAVLSAVEERLARLRVGAPDDTPEPFMGPVISPAAADAVVAAQAALEAQGARVRVRCRRGEAGTGFVTPGLVDVTGSNPPDEEVFGPLLQVRRVADFEAAVAAANQTRYGLAAGLISARADLYQRFRDEVRAGVVNWNHPLTGASGAAPFGGVGRSGNHRPSGFFAADYCAFPVASLESPTPALPATPLPGLD